jgi:hypothetical protein
MPRVSKSVRRARYARSLAYSEASRVQELEEMESLRVISPVKCADTEDLFLWSIEHIRLCPPSYVFIKDKFDCFVHYCKPYTKAGLDYNTHLGVILPFYYHCLIFPFYKNHKRYEVLTCGCTILGVWRRK